MKSLGDFHELREVGKLIGIAWDFDEGDERVSLFEFRRYDVFRMSGSQGEGDEGWGDVDLIEGARHGIFTSNGTEAKGILCFERSE